MFEEFFDEGKDFFEDIFEHLFEKDEEKHKDTASIERRTHMAFLFTERIDSLMKIIFGISIFIFAIIASVWGFTALGDLVRGLLSSLLGRSILIILGISYLINGFWRLFHPRSL